MEYNVTAIKKENIVLTINSNNLHNTGAENPRHIESDEFRTMFAASLDGFLIVAVTGHILEANDSYCRMMGYNHEELVNIHMTEIDAIESPGDVSKRVEELISRGTLRFQTRHIHKNGSIVDVEVSTTYSPTNGGRFYSLIRDITEHKQYEKALRHSEEQYRNIVENQTEFVDRYLPGGILTYVNKALVKFSGLPEEQLLGTSFYPFLLETDRAETVSRIESITIDNPMVETESRIVLPDERIRWNRWTHTGFFDDSGNLIEYQSVGRDITERREARFALEESENRYRTLFQKAGEGICIISQLGKLIQVNEAFAQSHGYEINEMLGMNIRDLDVNGGVEKNPERGQAILFGETITFEVEHYHKDGHIFPLEVKASLISLGGESLTICFHRDIFERMQAEKMLRESEHLFRALVASSSQSVWSFRPDGLSQIEQIDRANASWWCEYTGQSEAQRTADDGMGWLDAVYESDREKAKNIWQKIITSSEPASSEYRVYRRDGELRWLLVRGVPIGDNQGAITEIAGTVSDITERKKAELSLQKLSFEMERLLETSSTGLTRCSRDLHYLSANTAYAKLAGVPRVQIIGKPIVEVIGEAGLAAIRPYIERVLNGESVEYETPVHFQAGGDRYLHIAYTPDKDENGDIIGWVASITDVSDRKQAEIYLKEKEYELEQAQLLAKTGSWTYDPVIQKSTWSKAMFSIWGLDPSLGLFPVEDHKKYIHPDDYPKFEAFLKEAAEHGVPYTMELRIKRPDGIEKTIITICEPLCDSTGKVVKLRGTNQDITERKRAEEERQLFEQQLQHTQKLESLGVLSGGIAHDFNNILAIIIGYCGLIKMDYETADKNIPEIEKAAERAAALCRQMMSYAGKAQLTMTQVNMWAMVDEMITLLKSTLPQNAEVKSDLPTNLPYINGDASQLRQIVMNLIINSSEAIGIEQGEIRVSLDKVTVSAKESIVDYNGKIISYGEYVCLEVTDNGCGMDEETKWRVFEPFYTTKFTGRGLGMSAVLGIITSHNGALQLFSQLGRGTTFRVYLPVPKNDSARDENITSVTPFPAWQGSGTILLVEDEDQVRLIAKAFLEMFGFTVLEAENGREALELFMKNSAKISLVVTDIGMPVMDGYKLFGALKNLSPKLPIIISSGFGDTAITSRLGSDNVAGIISKPYNANQLRDVLKKAVGGE